MTKVVFICDSEANVKRVFAAAFDRLAAQAEIYPKIITSQEMLEANFDKISDADAFFSTWGMPALDEKIIKRFRNLKYVFYAAGSVKYFAEPFLRSGVKVISAWQANGLPVAEFTLGHILLATSGYFRNIREYKPGKSNPFRGEGSYREKIGIIGGGCIGRRVIELLSAFDFEIHLFDPCLSSRTIRKMGAVRSDFDELFEKCIVVSNHLPLNDETREMVEGRHFEMMRENATFINTGRGATVDEEAMLAVLSRRPSVQAVLDVTVNEPPHPDSLLYTLPNVLLSSHIAGSKGNELYRMADYCLSEFERLQKGESLMYEVTSNMLPTMA